MTPQQFQAAFQPYADEVAKGTGLSAGLFLAQWAVETAYASSFAGAFNLGNITRGGASNGFVNYGSYAQYAQAQILLLHDIPYEGVLAAAGKTLAEQCVALGASPWDAGHYNNGGGPGSSLIAVLPAFGLSAQSIGGLDLTPEEHTWLQFCLEVCQKLNDPTNGDLAGIAAIKAELAASGTTQLAALIQAIQANTAQLSAQTTELNAISTKLSNLTLKAE